ncbi:MAG TPA: SH3 domain-containing protein [Acidimicrobiales bacterium]
METTFLPTHVTGPAGAESRRQPDAAAPVVATIDAGVDVEIRSRRGDWAEVVCSNGWSAWVDGRRLVEQGDAPVQVAGVRITALLVSGVVLVVATFLPWVSQLGLSESSFGVSLKVLTDPKTQNPGGLKLGFVMIVLAGVVLGAALGRLPAVAARGAGGAAVVLTTVFVAQLQRAIGQAQLATVFGVLGVGVYLTMAAGIVAAMSKGGDE